MFRIQLETDNAAFEGDPAPEIARILEKLADDVRRHGHMSDGYSERFPLYDVNGNRVGFATFDGEG